MTLESQTIDSDALKLNLTESGRVSTSGMKEEHNSDPHRLKNLKTILDNTTVKQKLQKKGIRYDMSGNLMFTIQHSNDVRTEFEIKDIGAFYRMLKKHTDIFFGNPENDTSPYYGDVYEITGGASREANLFGMFLHDYTEDNGDFYNEFETEREKIDAYREDRMTAIEDTLSHSGEFISGRNARRYGETPFYDMVKDDPILRKKCILLADKCADNSMFVRFIKKHVSNGNKSLYFFDFIRKLDQDSIDSFSLLFQSSNFVSVFVDIFNRLPGADRDFNKIIGLIKNKENIGVIFSFFSNLNDFGVKNTIIFIKYGYINWEKYIVSGNDNFLNHFNSFDNFGEHYVQLLCEIAILPNHVIIKMIKNWNERTALNIYIYITEQADGYDDFITKLGMVFENTKMLQHIVWLDCNNIEDRLTMVEKNPKHVIEKLNQGKNPIGAKGMLGRVSYPDLQRAA